ncbi:MAG: PIF1 family ATP-dependent DNA helicase [Desulfosporosinus sp.]|nr:PIF1 family ATP-dependent DNA helicase [Desulfosporosinus sp.]
MKRALCETEPAEEGGSPEKRSRVEEAPPALSPSQERVLAKALTGVSFFFTGPAGTGKSFVLERIRRGLIEKYDNNEDAVYLTASTGLAACNIGGTTLHGFAGVGLGDAPIATILKDLNGSKPWNKDTTLRWNTARALIIDECSMIQPDFFEKLDKIGRYTRKNNSPFGGLQVILCGDFFQLPPVNKDKKRGGGRKKHQDETNEKYIFQTDTWHNLIGKNILVLTEVFRQQEPEFRHMLEDFRYGNLSKESIALFQQRRNATESAEDLPTDTVKLYATRNEVDIINFLELDKIKDAQTQTYYALDSGDQAIVTKMEEHWMAPKVITLKNSASVMLVYNVSFSRGLVNGLTGKVIGFNEQSNYPIVSFSNGVIYTVTPAKWEIKLGKKVLMRHFQVPLIPSYAVTIHKSQGMSIRNVEVNTSKLFEKAQLYTALSRGMTLGGLYIRGTLPKADLLKPDPKVMDWWVAAVNSESHV